MTRLPIISCLLVLAGSLCSAQTPAAPPQAAQPPAQAEPHGTVLFERHDDATDAKPQAEIPAQEKTAKEPTGPELSDAERDTLTFTAYTMDVRLQPASAGLTARATVTVRNDSASPLTRMAMQISSTLHWESIALVAPGATTKLEFAQHLLDTDADHTGKANEVIVTLPQPLKPGEEIKLDTFYSGTAAPSAGRLERLGASPQQASATDWDGITPQSSALRGFGNVLWYPVASPQLFLGEGAQLFEAIGRTELREQDATMRFRVGVEYSSDPPVAVYFCGRRQPLVAQSDAPNSAIAAGAGIATAEFPAEKLGFRLPSLFVIEKQETTLAPLPAASIGPTSSSSSSSSSEVPAPVHESAPDAASSAPDGVPMLAVESDDTGALPALEINAQHVASLLQSWLGPQPLSALTILDHSGQVFEDGPLLVAPVVSLATSTAQPAMAHSLAHAWVQTGQPWMDEGLAQFFALLWIEHERGRDAAVLQMNDMLQPLAIAEPNIEKGKPAPVGQPLVAATSEVFFRRKAAAVWFMLRTLAGEDALKASLRAWRAQPLLEKPANEQALAFEALLQKESGKDLHWFFDDWVLNDRGLPDLSIVTVAPRQLPVARSGRTSGWVVAVTVHNDGAAAAEVPVVVRSGDFRTTSTLRVPGFDNATARIQIESAPTEVVVNDGSVPEIQNVRHVRSISIPATPPEPTHP